MVTNRVTVSLDKDAQSALNGLVGRTDKAQSELVREAFVFYAANFEAATTDAGPNLEAYHQMLSSGEHVLFDVDFPYMFLSYMEGGDGESAPELLDAIDRVAAFHAHEYRDRFESLAELLDWLSFCDFLTARASEGNTFHAVSPTESVKWSMSWSIAPSTGQSPLDIEVEEGVSKVLFIEVRRGPRPARTRPDLDAGFQTRLPVHARR